MAQITGNAYGSGGSHPDAAISDAAYQARLDRIARHPAMSDENTRFQGGTRAVQTVCAVAGLAGLALWLLGFVVVPYKHAMASFMVGTFTVLAPCVGALFLVMIWHMFNASWPSSVRRVFENIASVIWLPIIGLFVIAGVEVFVAPNFEKAGLFLWLAPKFEGTFLIEHKEPFLNAPFFLIRLIAYAFVWWFLSSRLLKLSEEMDATGDRWLKRRARQMSGWGLLIMALATAFAAYDFLMALDFRFFSTMWGVYYFASSMLAGIAVGVIVLTLARLRGKLTVLVTKEHFHDLGKLMFAFVVFWGYIAFSQYFLIWYANIPEETYWFIYRSEGGWFWMGVALCVLHFIVPFLIMLVRKIKESAPTMLLMAIWMIAITVIDMLYIIRPMAYAGEGAPTPGGPVTWWVDAAAIVGCLGVFGFVLARQIGSKTLVPTKDPLMMESIKHINPV